MPGWREGVPLMVAGEKRRFWIPEELAYKNSTRPGATGNTHSFSPPRRFLSCCSAAAASAWPARRRSPADWHGHPIGRSLR